MTVAVAAFLLLAGCAAEPDGGAPSASPSPRPSATSSVTPSPDPSPSTTPTPTSEPEPAPPARTTSTCQSLLDGETSQRFADSAADGWALIPDFGQRMIDQANPIGLFVQYNGVACQWGYPSSGDAFSYGHSAISIADAQAVKSRLTADGYSSRSALGGELYCLPPEQSVMGEQSCFLFVGGEWFYSNVESELEMIVAQAG
ncbi:hypothetical protein ABIB15_001194 [Marisediminicola sp. UYEF4]|uniref:hypothetical protein n=1 Tax=Marisediminicola sp. UYEF4 TaxID=1756384 RepID=UPI00339A6F39